MTKRTRQSETAFLSLYKLLAEAPDPAPILAAACVGAVPAWRGALVG